MSAKGQEDPGEDLTSRVGAESPCSDMKRAAAKKLIERYFYQLTDGCGNPQCDNQHCASSGKVTNLTPNQAAAQAIQLFSQEARLCDGTQPNKVARTTIEPGPASLAKSLPVKSVNPTCSDEGIGRNESREMSGGFEAVESNAACFTSGFLFGSIDSSEPKETPCSSFDTPKKLQVAYKNVTFAPRNVFSINESTSVSKNVKLCTQSPEIDETNSPVSENILPKLEEQTSPNSNSDSRYKPEQVSSQNSSNAHFSQPDYTIAKSHTRQSRGSKRASVASTSASSIKSIYSARHEPIPQRTYAKSLSPRRTRYRGGTRRCKTRGGLKGRSGDVIERKSLRAKRIVNSGQAGNRQLQQLVRKLVVLTLYLRYLEVKRSFRSMKHNEF